MELFAIEGGIVERGITESIIIERGMLRLNC